MEIWTRLFDSNGFLPRTQCGPWTPALLRLHNISDFFIWTAYLAIPIVLVYFASKRRGDLPFQQLFLLFGLFIVACGTTHLLDILMFYNPLYRLSGVVKLITAAASWGTVIALKDVVPRALAMRSPEDFEREISERKRAEAEVRELNASLESRVRERTFELEQANAQKDELLAREKAARLEAETANRTKDDFLATVSHELRTPLNAMLGWSNLLSTQNLDEETRAEAVETIERSARSQMQIIDDILDVSRFIMGKMHLDMQPVDMVGVVDAALLAARPATDAKHIEVQTFFAAENALVSGDPHRLQQVVWNIVTNAVKFTPKNGRILARLTRVDSRVELAITDTGEGIAPEFLPFVFDRFRQADSTSTRQHGGLGLGLSIVRHIVELHGGTVRVESAGAGQGATFTFSLPVLAIDAPANTETNMVPANGTADTREEVSSDHSVPGGVLNDVRVLVVDDDADARRMISKALELKRWNCRALKPASHLRPPTR